jgi:hypothetical protein
MVLYIDKNIDEEIVGQGNKEKKIFIKHLPTNIFIGTRYWVRRGIEIFARIQLSSIVTRFVNYS